MSSQSLHSGWLPDLPDHRDWDVDSTEISQSLAKLKSFKSSSSANTSVDLRQWCSPVEDQSSIGSCTAHAGVGLIEFYEKRAFGHHLNASRLFLYKVTRNLMGSTTDSGAYLRDTMKAMALFGVPAERYWPYDISKFNDEPSAFCYAFGQNYQALNYYRLDTAGISRADLLTRIKRFLDAGLPSMFGFSVYPSIGQAGSNDGKIPYPANWESINGGHAVVAVGYDDKLKIVNSYDGSETTGAILIRNSWGKGWGDKGYGWLPYDYVLKGQAVDWWSLLKNEWLDTGQFN